jgi:phage-related protein
VTQAHAAVLAVQAAGGLAAMIKGLPVVTALTKSWAAVQWVLNAALIANPIGLVVVGLAALSAGLVIAYGKSETFRDVVDGAVRAVGNAFGWLSDKSRAVLNFVAERWNAFKGTILDGKATIANALGNLFDGIHGAWTGVRSWIGERWSIFREWVGGWGESVFGKLADIFGGIRTAWTTVREWVGERWESFKTWITGQALNFGGMFDGLSAAFKSAVNAIISGWNGLSFSIPGFNPPGPGNFPGVSVGTPNIPYLAEGGIVRRPTLAVVGEAGPEAVIPLSKMGSGHVTNHYEFHIHDATDP